MIIFDISFQNNISKNVLSYLKVAFRITKFLINNYYILYLSFSNTIYYILYTLLSFSELIFLAFFLFFFASIQAENRFYGQRAIEDYLAANGVSLESSKIEFF